MIPHIIFGSTTWWYEIVIISSDFFELNASTCRHFGVMNRLVQQNDHSICEYLTSLGSNCFWKETKCTQFFHYFKCKIKQLSPIRNQPLKCLCFLLLLHSVLIETNFEPIFKFIIMLYDTTERLPLFNVSFL